MALLLSDAYAAQGSGGSEATGLAGLLPLVLIFVVFYFLLIRPQQKRSKEHRQMVESLSKGDEVVTNGGLLGRVTRVNDNFITMEIADKLEVRVQRQSVAAVMPKGTMKSA